MLDFGLQLSDKRNNGSSSRAKGWRHCVLSQWLCVSGGRCLVRYRFARYPLAVTRIYKTKTQLTPSNKIWRQVNSVSLQKPSKQGQKNLQSPLQYLRMIVSQTALHEWSNRLSTGRQVSVSIIECAHLRLHLHPFNFTLFFIVVRPLCPSGQLFFHPIFVAG